MSKPLRRRVVVLLSVTIAVPGAVIAADSPARAVVGWVESTRGLPVAGALVSVMGSGLRSGGVRAIADDTGRFVLPPLPAGLYTLRAVGLNHLPSVAQRLTLLPNAPTALTLSLQPVAPEPGLAKKSLEPVAPSEPELFTPPTETDSPRTVEEWRWLVRHRQRSVLESTDFRPGDSLFGDMREGGDLPESLPFLSPLGGTIEVVAGASGAASPTPGALGAAGAGSLALAGRLPELGTWALDGLLSESETSAWRMAAEFILEPVDDHVFEVGAGYGESGLQSEPVAGASIAEIMDGRADFRSVGAVSLRDRWELLDGLTASVGARYSYFGFLAEKNRVDPSASIEVRGPGRSRLALTADSRSTAPGGDLLTLSTLTAAPMASLVGLPHDARAQRLYRYGVRFSAPWGRTTLVAHVFQEDVRNQILTSFEDSSDGGHTLQTRNGGAVFTRGVGFTVTRRLGRSLAGAVTYTWGRSWRPDPVAQADSGHSVTGEFHDIVARVETVFGWSGTRVAAYCRLNTLDPAIVRGVTPGSVDGFAPRFDVQLAQRVPLLASLTRADWEILLSFRNLFYEEAEAGTLDELAVASPQRRVLGGVSVRF